MSLMPSALSAQAFRFDNWSGASPSSTMGTSITPGTSGAEGSWTAVAGGANLTSDVYLVSFQPHAGATTSVDKSHLFDIGVDPAGGTSYTEVISNIVAGHSCAMNSAPAQGNIAFLFPIFIKAGSSVAVRCQGSHSTPGTVRVIMSFRGQPASPHQLPVGAYAETIGAITGTQGVTFTPGNGTEGAWELLGTTTRPCWWWQLAFQVSNAAMTAEYCVIELAHGDASNKHLMIKLLKCNLTTEATGVPVNGNIDYGSCYWPLPAGTNIYVRGKADSAPDTGYNAVAIGIGG